MVASLSAMAMVAGYAWAYKQPEPGRGTRVAPRLAAAPKAQKPAGRLNTTLDRLVRRRAAGGTESARLFAREHALDVSGDTVVVVVEAAKGKSPAARTAIKHSGAAILRSYGNLIKARAPISKLAALSVSDGVSAVRPPIRPAPDITSEGVTETGADRWHAVGNNGAGVKVGIIDAGFIGYPAMLGTELPPSVTTWGGSAGGDENGGSEHGAAVAEVIHDVAPGASLYLARIEDDVELGLAKDWMKAQGVQVINHSMGWFGTEGGNGSGPINTIVNDAVANGIFWANSAGNDRRRHWMGDFTDTDMNNYINWDGTGWELNTFGAYEGWPIVGHLWWNDSWTNASQDYDLYLYWWNSGTEEWEEVDGSANVQDGSAGRTPHEAIGVYAPATGIYGWVIHRWSATQTNVDFDLHSWYQDLDEPLNPNGHFFDHARSISVPADNNSNGFMAAAAIGRATGYAQEDYSSEGPTRDGRTAPEIAAPSDVLNSVYGTFPGTSSSSPHLAGAVAVIKSAATTWTAQDMEAHFEANAGDLGTPGADNQFGSGRLYMSPTPFTPSGSMVINGDAPYATSANVTVNSAISGANWLRLRNLGGVWSGWMGFASSSPWMLSAQDGTKTVEAEYRSIFGFSATYQDTIVLDATPPSGTMSLNGGATHTNTAAVAVNSAVTGASEMRFRDSGGAWDGWESYSAAKSWVLPGGDGTKTVEAEYRDAAGNTSPLSDDIVLDTAAPIGTMTINDDEGHTTSHDVTITSSVAGADEMRLRNPGGAWSSWGSYADAKPWTLPAPDDTKTVEAQYRDLADNTLPLSDTILLDSTSPSPPGGFSATPGDGRVDLAWTRPPEPDFDVLRVLRSDTSWATSPTDTVGQTLVVDDTSTVESFFDISVSNGTTYFYSAYSRDQRGNWSGGAHASALPRAPTTTTATTSRALVLYGDPVIVSATLTDPGGPLVLMPGMEVWGRPLTGGAWTKRADAPYDLVTSSYRAAVPCTRNTYLKARFTGSALHTPSESAEMLVRSRAWLGRPWTYPRTITHQRAFYIFGYVKPRHSGYSRLYFYRKVGGQWRFLTQRPAKNYNYKTYSRYRLRYWVLRRGYYYVRALHFDTDHYGTYGPARVFFVR